MRLIFILAVNAILTGCMAALPPIAYQEGITKKQANNEIVDCSVTAAQKVPVNKGVYTTPSYTTPVRCLNSFGAITCSGGQTVGGNMVSYDANAQLRERVYVQCMENKGYQFIDYKVCPKDIQKKHNQKLALEGNNLNAKLISPFNNSCAYLSNQTTFTVDLTAYK